MIDFSTFSRLGFTIGLGIIVILVPFLKSGPDTRMAKWRKDGEGSWFNFATNEDGSLKKYAKISLIAVFVFLIILVWVVPDKFIGVRTFKGSFLK
ncbi:MAG: hypothetical protein JWQ35_729 [Bacteriovoracaceae bacterium]|nr:hypothetical protein [Bacteriovoracaceae bacterium]